MHTFVLALLVVLAAGLASVSTASAASAASSAMTPESQVYAAAADVEPLAVGTAIPKAQLRTAAGDDAELGAQLAGRLGVLIFYRGGW